MVKAAGIYRTREDQMQFLRFGMFLMVFFLHMSMPEIYPVWNGGVSAVSFFFMLSGALLGFYAVGKRCELSVKNIVSDALRKAGKQYDLYLITMLFAIFWSELPVMVVNFRFGEMKQPLLQLGRNLLMIQSWFSEGYFSYNGVGWYLSTLMFLCLLNLPLTALLRKIDSRPGRVKICVAAMALCIGLTALYSYVTDVEDIHFWQYIFLPARMGQYICSTLLGYCIRLAKNKISEDRKTYWFFTAAEIGALLFWFASLYTSTMSWHVRLVDGFAPNILLIGVFLMGQGGISRLFRWKPLVKLGNLSADCYLLHQIVINLFFTLSGVEAPTVVSKLLCGGFCLGFTLAVAWFLDRKVRK